MCQSTKVLSRTVKTSKPRWTRFSKTTACVAGKHYPPYRTVALRLTPLRGGRWKALGLVLHRSGASGRLPVFLLFRFYSRLYTAFTGRPVIWRTVEHVSLVCQS